jgi:arabinan endo-1,5-alpha-L-arabinosidase
MGRRTTLVLLFALFALTSHGQTGDVRGVHDPSIIRAGDSYYIFCTGKGIPVRRSNDLIHWKLDGHVFNAVPAWARTAVPGVNAIWAPDISYFNGKYHLYYACSTFGSNRSLIGLATNKTLDSSSKDFRWVDRGMVIDSKKSDNFNAIDPNVAFDETNRPWLCFGSFWSGIKLIRLDPDTGKPARDAELLSIADRNGGAIEAPFIVHHGDWFYLFVSFDFCCRGTASDYHVAVGRARQITGTYIDRDGAPMMQAGGTTILESSGSIRGPGHEAILHDQTRDYIIHHFYDAEKKGTPTLQIRPLTWSDDGWPVVGHPMCNP